MLRRLKRYTQIYFVKQTMLYLGHHFLGAMFYLILISFITFFHFLLGHKLSEIQEWVIGYGWQLVILSKLCALFSIFLFVDLERPSLNYYKSLVEKKFKLPDWDILVATLFSIIFFAWMADPRGVSHHQFQLIRFILSVVGMTVFFVTDLILLVLLQIIYPLDKKVLRCRLFVFSTLFWLLSMVTYSFAEDMSILVLGHFFLSQFLLSMDKSNYSGVLFFIAMTSAAFVFFGKDPIWGSLFSTYKINRQVGFAFVIIWSLTVIGHQSFKKSKIFIKLKRKVQIMTT